MRKSLVIVVVLTVSLFALMWGYSAFIASYPASGWWGMIGPNMMAGPGMWADMVPA